jgi:hypothetical protein
MNIEATRSEGNKTILVNMDRIDYLAPNGNDPDKPGSIIYFSSDRSTVITESYSEITNRINKKESIRNLR